MSLADEFSEHARWVGPRINGGGVDDEAATWVTNSLDDDHPAAIFPVSDAAGRYSYYTTPIAITGDGQDMILSCLG